MCLKAKGGLALRTRRRIVFSPVRRRIDQQVSDGEGERLAEAAGRDAVKEGSSLMRSGGGAIAPGRVREEGDRLFAFAIHQDLQNPTCCGGRNVDNAQNAGQVGELG